MTKPKSTRGKLCLGPCFCNRFTLKLTLAVTLSPTRMDKLLSQTTVPPETADIRLSSRLESCQKGPIHLRGALNSLRHNSKPMQTKLKSKRFFLLRLLNVVSPATILLMPVPDVRSELCFWPRYPQKDTSTNHLGVLYSSRHKTTKTSPIQA